MNNVQEVFQLEKNHLDLISLRGEVKNLWQCGIKLLESQQGQKADKLMEYFDRSEC